MSEEEGAWDGYDVGEMDKLLDVVDSALCAVVDELQDDSRSSRRVHGDGRDGLSNGRGNQDDSILPFAEIWIILLHFPLLISKGTDFTAGDIFLIFCRASTNGRTGSLLGCSIRPAKLLVCAVYLIFLWT